ncbi:gem-associated protein 2-like isoform X1 [Stylophora pistillata]|uniref:gem-associated protein 2-like isoform X1 n=1 Tax=Stylophora pistillata TaxID=50429 RepID=UPI000C055E9D|nr:gem-associated protein 2-like isoform X1 [Stylophora pistillata]
MEPVLGTFEQDDWENDDRFDESKLPSSGYEYLRRVHFEAMQCPDVVVASLDTNSFQSKQTVHVNERSGWSPAPAGFAPSADWQTEQAADFADIRQKLAHHRSKPGKEYSTKLALPRKSDSMGWCQFCLGEQIAMKIFGRKDNKKTVNDEKALEGSNLQTTNQEGTPPLLSVLLQINQATLLQVLEYHVEWLEEIGFSHDQGKWFYALLVCLEKPLLPETTSLLRTLARLCATLRASLESPYHQLVTPLNLMITLVSRYFGQSDLADPG